MTLWSDLGGQPGLSLKLCLQPHHAVIDFSYHNKVFPNEEEKDIYVWSEYQCYTAIKFKCICFSHQQLSYRAKLFAHSNTKDSLKAKPEFFFYHNNMIIFSFLILHLNLLLFRHERIAWCYSTKLACNRFFACLCQQTVMKRSSGPTSKFQRWSIISVFNRWSASPWVINHSLQGDWHF